MHRLTATREFEKGAFSSTPSCSRNGAVGYSAFDNSGRLPLFIILGAGRLSRILDLSNDSNALIGAYFGLRADKPVS